MTSAKAGVVACGVLIAASLASLLPQVALAFYAFPSADDYCAAVPPRDGFWQAQAFWYVSFTGRYTEMFLESIVTRWELSRIYPWFILATFAGTALAIRALVSAMSGDDERSRAWVNVVTLVAFALFAGGLPSTVEAFYWMSSAVAYQWAIAVFTFWVALLITLVTRPLAPPARARSRALVAFLTLLVPGFNEVIAPLIFAALVGIVGYNKRRGLESHRFLMIVAAVIVALTLVSFLAPGNVARSQVYGDDPTRYNLAYSLWETGRQTARFVTRFGAYPALWLGALGGWWWMRRSGVATAVAPQYLAGSVAALMSVVYLSLFPLYWVYGSQNYTGEGRTYNITYVAFFIAVMILVRLVLDACVRRYPNWFQRQSRHGASVDLVLACALAILLVSAPSARQAVRAFVDASEYLERQHQREALLRVAPADGTTVVEEIAIRPAGLFWGDIQRDEEHWINRCVAAYYCLEAVRARKPPFRPEVTGPLVNARRSDDALCTLDRVNGEPLVQPLAVPRTILSLTGWAYDRGSRGGPSEVFVVLTAPGWHYSMRANRIARPDVAEAFRNPKLKMSGFAVEGSIADLPPDDYEVTIVQKRRDGFVSCGVPSVLTLMPSA